MDSKMAADAVICSILTGNEVYIHIVQKLCSVIKVLESSDFVGSNYSDMTCVSPLIIWGKQSQILPET